MEDKENISSSIDALWKLSNEDGTFSTKKRRLSNNQDIEDNSPVPEVPSPVRPTEILLRSESDYSKVCQVKQHVVSFPSSWNKDGESNPLSCYYSNQECLKAASANDQRVVLQQFSLNDFNVETNQEPISPVEINQTINAMQWTPDGKILVLGAGKFLHLIDGETHQLFLSYPILNKLPPSTKQAAPEEEEVEEETIQVIHFTKNQQEEHILDWVFLVQPSNRMIYFSNVNSMQLHRVVQHPSEAKQVLQSLQISVSQLLPSQQGKIKESAVHCLQVQKTTHHTKMMYTHQSSSEKKQHHLLTQGIYTKGSFFQTKNQLDVVHDIQSLAFSSDGQHLFVADETNFVSWYESRHLICFGKYQCSSSIRSLHYMNVDDANRQKLVVLTMDQRVHILECFDFQIKELFCYQISNVSDRFSISMSRNHLVLCDGHGEIIQFHVMEDQRDEIGNRSNYPEDQLSEHDQEVAGNAIENSTASFSVEFMVEIQQTLQRLDKNSGRQLGFLTNCLKNEIHFTQAQDYFQFFQSLQDMCGQTISSTIQSLEVHGWILNMHVRFTTFTIISDPSETRVDVQRWIEFQTADLVTEMCKYMKKGALRAVRTIWRRHFFNSSSHSLEDRFQSFEQILQACNNSSKILSSHVMLSWLCQDILPQFSSKPAFVATIYSFLYQKSMAIASEPNQFEQSLKIVDIIVSKNKVYSPSSAMRIVNDERVIELTQQFVILHQQLNACINLRDRHHFQISLSGYQCSTSVNITLGMLDNISHPEDFATEIHSHVGEYITKSNLNLSQVLLQYIQELSTYGFKTSQMNDEQDQQKRAVAIIHCIPDEKVRADAILELLRGLSSLPYAPEVLAIAEVSTEWKASRVKEELQEQRRLMSLQALYARYGFDHFHLADPTQAKRFLSHIMAQVHHLNVIADIKELISNYNAKRQKQVWISFMENIVLALTASGGSSTKAKNGLLHQQLETVVNHLEKNLTDTKMMHLVGKQVISFCFLLMIQQDQDHAQKKETTSQDLSRRKELLYVLERLLTLTTTSGAKAEDVKKNREILAKVQTLQLILKEYQLYVAYQSLDSTELKSEVVANAIFRTMSKAKEKQQQPFLPSSLVHNIPKKSKGKGKQKQLRSEVNTNKALLNQKTEEERVEEREQLDGVNGINNSSFHASFRHLAKCLQLSSGQLLGLLTIQAIEFGWLGLAFEYITELLALRPMTDSESILVDIISKLSGYMQQHLAAYEQLEHMLQSLQCSPSRPEYQHAVHLSKIPTVALEILGSLLSFGTPTSGAGNSCILHLFHLYHCIEMIQEVYENTMLAIQLRDMSTDDDDDVKQTSVYYPHWYPKDSPVLATVVSMDLVTKYVASTLAKRKSACSFDDESHPRGVLPHELKRLLSHLMEHNAVQFAFRIFISCCCPIPLDSIDLVMKQQLRIIESILGSPNIDTHYALGVLLSLEGQLAYEAFRNQLTKENMYHDFRRIQTLAALGMDAARAWDNDIFLYHCADLCHNAKWWYHFHCFDPHNPGSTSHIEINHQAFVQDHRDVPYLRTLVPTLFRSSNYEDLDLVLAFTRHYHIEDSYPSSLYVEHVLLSCEDDYRSKAALVLDDIHAHELLHVVTNVILPRVSPTAYAKLIYCIEELLIRRCRHVLESEKVDELTRHRETLHILTAYAASSSSSRSSSDDKIPFHALVQAENPWTILGREISSDSVSHLSLLSSTLLLDKDEFYMMLLRNGVLRHDGHEFPSFTIETLDKMQSIENRITIAEWMAEKLLRRRDKLEACQLALAAVCQSRSLDRIVHMSSNTSTSSSSFLGEEAQDRLERKIERLEMELILETFEPLATNEQDLASFCMTCSSSSESESELILNRNNTGPETPLDDSSTLTPEQVFLKLYHVYILDFALSPQSLVNDQLHVVTNALALKFELSSLALRQELVEHWLLKDTHPNHRQPGLEDDDDASSSSSSDHGIFSPDATEIRSSVDAQSIFNILYICLYLSSGKTHEDTADHHSKNNTNPFEHSLGYLVTFAMKNQVVVSSSSRSSSSSQRASVVIPYRAKSRALSVVTFLSHARPSVESLVQHIAGCSYAQFLEFGVSIKYMIEFEEMRIPHQLRQILEAQRQSQAIVVHGLWRQYRNHPRVCRLILEILKRSELNDFQLWKQVLCKLKDVGVSQHRYLFCQLEQVFQMPLVFQHSLGMPWLKSILHFPFASLPVSTSQEDTSEENSAKKDDQVTFILTQLVRNCHQCPFVHEIDLPWMIHQLVLKNYIQVAIQLTLVLPSPGQRAQALFRMMHERRAAVNNPRPMMVLNQLCPSILVVPDREDDSENDLDDGDTNIMQNVFELIHEHQDYCLVHGSVYDELFGEYLLSRDETSDVHAFIRYKLSREAPDDALMLIRKFWSVYHPELPLEEDPEDMLRTYLDQVIQ